MRLDRVLERAAAAVTHEESYFMAPNIHNTVSYSDVDHIVRFIVQYAVLARQRVQGSADARGARGRKAAAMALASYDAVACLKEALRELEWLVGHEDVVCKEWAIKRAREDEVSGFLFFLVVCSVGNGSDVTT